LLNNIYRTPVSGVFRGLWRKPGQRFAVCGGNPATAPSSRSTMKTTVPLGPIEFQPQRLFAFELRRCKDAARG
jgi:hypothetical protein